MLLIGRERGRGQIGKIPGESPDKSGKSRKNRESPKKDKKGRTSSDRETPRLKPPCLAALDGCFGGRRSHHVMDLAAQYEIPPHIAQYPFEIVSVSHALCLVFIRYCASIAEIPFLWGGGVSHLHFACSSKGETLRKGGGGIAPNWPC